MKIHLCTEGGCTVVRRGQHPMRQVNLAIEHKIAPHLNILSTSKEAETNVIPECIPTGIIILWHGINRVFTAGIFGI